jgi:hypothetical protein
MNDKKMSDELKPCPFCNCEMEIEVIGRDWWRIKPVDGHEDACPFGEQHEWDCSQQKPEWKDEHIADWNKRTDDRLTEENKQLREAFKELKSIAIQEREWRLEDSECGMGEVQESIDTLSFRIDELLNK